MSWGAVLALGALAGLLVLRGASSGTASLQWIVSELASETLFYAYLAIVVLASFAAFGWWFGCREDRLREDSGTDPLTGLANRRRVDERLREELARVRRYAAPLSLLLIDVDKLKEINDRLGHLLGDEALRTVAMVLGGACRSTDIPGRYGGDEFVVVAPATGGTDALALAERICEAVAAAHGCETQLHGHLRVSVGVADTDHVPCREAVRLLNAADDALYEAKSFGGSRVALAGLVRENGDPSGHPESGVYATHVGRA